MTETNELHVAIVGAGTIGCYIGGRLSGHARVTLIGRRRMAEAIRSAGLSVSDWQGFHRHIEAAEVTFKTDINAVAHADIVLVTVKTGATPGVARELDAALSRPTLIISLQNGLHNADILRQHLAAHTVLAGMVPFNVVHRAPATFHQGSSGAMMVQADVGVDDLLKRFRAAGLDVIQRSDMPAVQRAKLLLNLNNAINALSNLPLREELAQRNWRLCLALAQREALRAFDAAGLQCARLTALPPNWMPALLSLSDRWFRVVAARILAIDPLARSSMWEDLQAGRRTEVDAIQGEVIALATAQGLTAPVNAHLLALIRDAERTRSTVTGAELLSALKMAR